MYLPTVLCHFTYTQVAAIGSKSYTTTTKRNNITSSNNCGTVSFSQHRYHHQPPLLNIKFAVGLCRLCYSCGRRVTSSPAAVHIIKGSGASTTWTLGGEIRSGRWVENCCSLNQVTIRITVITISKARVYIAAVAPNYDKKRMFIFSIAMIACSDQKNLPIQYSPIPSTWTGKRGIQKSIDSSHYPVWASYFNRSLSTYMASGWFLITTRSPANRSYRRTVRMVGLSIATLKCQWWYTFL